jgi:hypothetical protein
MTTDKNSLYKEQMKLSKGLFHRDNPDYNPQEGDELIYIEKVYSKHLVEQWRNPDCTLSGEDLFRHELRIELPQVRIIQIVREDIANGSVLFKCSYRLSAKAIQDYNRYKEISSANK